MIIKTRVSKKIIEFLMEQYNVMILKGMPNAKAFI